MSARTKPKILVVDDDADSSQTLLCVLDPVAEVIEAANGTDALRMIRSERPDLMLLDVAMPEMGGLEVLEPGRRIAPRMIIVMLTGDPDIDVAKTALDRGARAYITKPVDAQWLRDEVRHLIGSSAPEGDSVRRKPWRGAHASARASAGPAFG